MFNPLNLEGRTILVTGASSGIGRATANMLSRLGARLVLLARDKGRLEQTLNQIEGSGHCIVTAELTQDADLPTLLREIVANVGKLHGLVHSAGVQIIRPLQFLKVEVIDETMDINVRAALDLASAFCQKHIAEDGGSIVFIASVMGMIGSTGMAAYAASKGAIIATTRAMAIELAPRRIRVNCVVPGLVEDTGIADRLKQLFTDTQLAAVESMHPLGLGRPDDVANAIAFLLADTGRWITGSNLIVDGGYTAQ